MKMYHTNSVVSQITETASQEVIPHVGMKCTQNYYTDRRVCTIVAVHGNSITVRDNIVKCIDYWDSKYEVTEDLTGNPKVFTKRKNGRWVRQGDSMNGLGLTLNSSDHYVDPSF